MAPVGSHIHDLCLKGTTIGQTDPYTGGHAWRVAQLSRLLAQAAGWSAGDQARIALGGFLHDLGKIVVPAAVLNKPGALTPEEFTIIKAHPSTAERLLASHPLAPLVLDAVASHHERLDGTGYPQGLAGDQVPADARIVSLADSFDAMTSNRPYRRGMPVDIALGILVKDFGDKYDGALGLLFTHLAKTGALDPIITHVEAGIPVTLCRHCRPVIEFTRHLPPGGAIPCTQCGASAQVTYLTSANRLFDDLTVDPILLTDLHVPAVELLNRQAAPLKG